MANQRPHSAVLLPRKSAGDQPGPPTDQQLLQRFVATHDEAAFAALVDRHGPMVLGVCRSVLRHAQDAEDACQATFLVLARQAGNIRKPGSLAHWLHGVAYRLAARARAERDRERERRAPVRAPANPLDELTGRELHRILHEEVGRLPESYRLPLILCYLEGQTQDEAARQLGWSVTTVKGRLDRGRNLLRRRLSRRGLSLGLPLFVASMARGTARGAPAGMSRQTARAAVRSLAGGATEGRAARAMALVEGWERAMLTVKWKVGAVLALAAAILGAGAGLAAFVAGEAGPPEARRKGEPAAPEPKPSADVRGRPKLDRRGDPLPDRAVVRFGSAHLRHGGRIYGSALSPDGKILVTAGRASVILWSLETGKPLRRFPCDQGVSFVCPGLAFSPDGSRLAYVRGDLFACVWDLQTGKELQRFQRQFKDGIEHFWNGYCQFAGGGKELVLLSLTAIETWDIESGKQTASVPARASCLFPDGKTYLGNQGEGGLLLEGLALGDARTGKEVKRLAVEVRKAYDGLAVSPDGKTLALVHAEKEIQLRKVASGKVLASFPLPDSARMDVRGGPYWQYRLAFSTDGKILLLGTGGGIIHRWDVASGKELPALSKHHCAVTGMYTLPDGRTLVSTGYDGCIRRWDLKTGRQEIDPKSYEGDSTAAYSRDGRLVAVADARGRIDLWDGREGTMIRTIQRTGVRVTHLAFSPDGKRLGAAQQSGTVQFWEVPSGRPGAVWRREPVRGEWYCNGILFSPDGRFLYVTDCPKQIRAVEVASGKLLWKGGGSSFGEALSPDGETLLVGRTGPYLALLDATTGEQRAKVHLNLNIQDGSGLPYTFAFSPDGRQIAVAYFGGALMLLNGRTCAERKRLVAGVNVADIDRILITVGKPPNRIQALAFSPDGRWLASAGTDTDIYLWETATGKEVLRLPGHEAEVSTLAFAPDGRTLFSYGQDGQGYLWDLAPRQSADSRVTLSEWWADLTGQDAPKAYRAIHALAAHPTDSIALLRKHLRPAAPVDPKRLSRLIADLDSERFAVREDAVRQLEALGDLAGPALRRALRGGPSLEKSRRIEGLLGKLEAEKLTPEQLRAVRAVGVLEYAGTPGARRLLKELAGGAEGARLTREAKASLGRLRR
jgi:RNA polymerase sigma factor (sigma-70 family)